METYYKPEDQLKFEEIGEEAPELAKQFFKYYGSVFEEGELSEREKALIADDRSPSCCYCNQGGSIPCTRSADEKYRKKNFAITAMRLIWMEKRK